MTQSFTDARRRPGYTPAVDIFEDGHEYRIVADLPGVRKDDLNLQLEKNELLIEAQMAEDAPNGDVTAAEFVPGAFARTFRVPPTVNAEGIRAELRHGVLTVRLPKHDAVKPRAIPVHV